MESVKPEGVARIGLAEAFDRTFGTFYVLMGVIGCIDLVGGTASQSGSRLLGIFGVTLVHNLVHLVAGAALLAGSYTESNARKTALAFGGFYILVGIAGLLRTDLLDDLLFINPADSLLHIGTGVLALAAWSGKLVASQPSVPRHNKEEKA